MRKKDKQVLPVENKAAADKVDKLAQKRRRNLEGRMKKSKRKDMWSLLLKISGSAPKEKSKTIFHNGISKTTDKQKAVAFVSEYTGYSKRLRKQDRLKKVCLIAELRRQTDNEDEFSSQKLRMKEIRLQSRSLTHVKLRDQTEITPGYCDTSRKNNRKSPSEICHEQKHRCRNRGEKQTFVRSPNR